MAGQMGSRAFAFDGTIILQVVGDQVTGEFRMQTQTPRIGELGGSYKDGHLLLTGFQVTELSHQCRGRVNIRLTGTESRLSGEIEFTDGCSGREFLGTIRMRR